VRSTSFLQYSPYLANSASLKALEERWAPFYAGLDKALKDAGARP
jgi:hypothetical protein